MLDITSRQAKLIEILARQKEYLPTKYYANYLNVSERTIFNDLSNLKGLLDTLNIKVDRKRNHGIKLLGDITSSESFIQHIIKQTNLEDSIKYSALERQIFIIKWLLIENKTVTYQSLSFDLYVSSTSIIKDMEQIKNFMDEDIKLISDVKGTRVVGTEIGIQKSLKRFLYYLIEQSMHNYSLASYGKILEPLFSKGVIDSVQHSMHELILAVDRGISEQYMKSLFISLLILTERSYQGNHLNHLLNVNMKETEYLTNYPLAVQICNNISTDLSFTFTELEYKYVSNQLFAHRVEMKVNNKYIENLLAPDIKQIIADVTEAMAIDLTADKKLWDALIYHMFPLIYRLKSDIIVTNPLLEEIKNDYGILFKIIWYVMEKFEKKYGVTLTDDDIAFITIHFQAAIERKEQMSQILVVCQTGLVTSDLIINRIKKLLPANIQFKLIAKPYLKNEDLTKVDFIISSVHLKDIERPVVYVSSFVNDTDLINIYSCYLKHSSTLRKKEDNKLNLNMISSYLNSRYVFLNEKLSTKEKCLEKMIDLFERDGIVKESFRASVYERERIGDTLVRSWVAVPHALQSTVNETKIAMMIPQKPIKWDNESYVSLIILLAVAEEDIVNIRKLLSHIYKVILKSESLEKSNFVQSIKQPEDLIAFFSK